MFIQETYSNGERTKRTISDGKFSSILVQIFQLSKSGEEIEMQSVNDENEAVFMLHVKRTTAEGKRIETHFTKAFYERPNVISKLEEIAQKIAANKRINEAMYYAGIDDSNRYEWLRRGAETRILQNGYWAIYYNFQKLNEDPEIAEKFGNMEF